MAKLTNGTTVSRLDTSLEILEPYPRSATLIEDLNARVLGLLLTLCKRPDRPRIPLLDLVAGDPLALQPGKLQRLAILPFVLCDLAFADSAQWTLIAGDGPYLAPRSGSSGSIPAPLAKPLARAALTAAWIAIGHDIRIASMLFGMRMDTALALRSHRLSDIERLSNANARLLKFRWDAHMPFWTRSLTALRDPTDVPIRSVALYGIQLLAGEALAAGSTAQIESRLQPPPSNPTQLPVLRSNVLPNRRRKAN